MKIKLENRVETPLELKVKIHRGEEVVESTSAKKVEIKKEGISFKTKIVRADETEEEPVEIPEINTDVELPVIPPVEEEAEEEEEIEIPSSDDEVSDGDSEEGNDDAEELAGDVVEETEEVESEDEEEQQEEIVEEYVDADESTEDIGIDESVFDTLTINGEEMNVVELNPEEEQDEDEIEEEEDDDDDYDDEDDYQDMIPAKYRNKGPVNNKKNRKKNIEED